MSKTLHFQNCLGVFQGGGCKGSAYVGAYKEAVKWGVSFSEIVGTSAGSIVAALLGAGATSDELEKMIKDLDFKKFLQPPVAIPQYTAPWLSSVVKFIPLAPTRKYHPILTHLGLYNSEFLGKWLETKLAKLLPHHQGPITFKDLVIPTSVIVTNLATKKVEIYSKEDTPNAVVSEAVRKSSNIPFFFQPIDMKYVDGGLLSNLPSFVFDDASKRMYNKILAFSLDTETSATEIKDFVQYSKSLLNTTLDGNLDLQLSLQNEVHIIRINTGTLAATDFELIDDLIVADLIKRGENAVNDFFSNELARLKTSTQKTGISRDEFNSNNFLTDTLSNKYDEILIASVDTEWVYELFPTLLNWIKQGSKVSMILQKGGDEEEHTHLRQRILDFFGVNLKLVDNIPFKGFVFDGGNMENCRSVVLKEKSTTPTYFSRLYEGEEDYYAIKCLREVLLTHTPPLVPNQGIYAMPIAHSELFDKLKNVRQYKNSQLYMSEIEISKMVFITKYLRGFKYRQIRQIFEIYHQFGMSLFEPAKFYSPSSQKFSIITPPILEKIGDLYYVIEGNTRLTYAHRNGMDRIKCVIVENSSEALPSSGRYNVREILLADRDMVGPDRYGEFDYKKFRKIEKAVRDPKTCLL
jgi:predicted acylesterase/phospholipase RssA